jgi:DNA-directed RNA polymerase III subunit RPC7
MACPLIPAVIKRNDAPSPRSPDDLIVSSFLLALAFLRLQITDSACFDCSVLKFFPRELWQTLQPNFRPDTSLDGYQAQASVAGVKRGFEDEEDEAGPVKRTAGGEDEDEGDVDADEAALLEADEEEEEIMDDDFSEDDDEMGGDYNAEQYFDDGEDDIGDEDGGGGGGDDEF